MKNIEKLSIEYLLVLILICIFTLVFFGWKLLLLFYLLLCLNSIDKRYIEEKRKEKEINLAYDFFYRKREKEN
jgi:hypothetical protein